MLVLLFGLFFGNRSCYAAVSSGAAEDLRGITPISQPTSTPTSAGLSIATANMISDPVTPGSIATVSTNVTVNVDNAESYSLTLSVDSTNIKSGNTTLTAGNVINDNTWGYKWDNASNYSTPSTSGTNLTVPVVDSNGTASFTKNLTFGAKFANTADAGHYTASGTLSLVATPKVIPITLANLTEMQQLSLAPEACNNTPYLSDKNYSATYTLTDVRDNAKYTIAKLGDGKCWMTSNLKLANRIYNDDGTLNSASWAGRTLKPVTSDVAANWTLPSSDTAGFSDNAASNAYLSGSTGYYTWCAATAGTCSSATSQGAHASSSICPKGWRLPGGFNDATYGNEFRNLFLNMDLTISNSNLANTSNGSTKWGSGDLAKVQASPYNFAYTGQVSDGTFYDPSSSGNQDGVWWSSTASSSSNAYALNINSSNVSPGTNSSGRRNGRAVRCVAE